MKFPGRRNPLQSVDFIRIAASSGSVCIPFGGAASRNRTASKVCSKQGLRSIQSIEVMPGCDTHSELRSVFERACIGVLSVSTADARDGMWYHISCDHVLGGVDSSSTSTAL